MTIFSKSKKGRNTFTLGPSGTGQHKITDYLPIECLRKKELDLPDLSENEVVRHFTDLSSKNFGVDKGMYPLGSCTMKYNPKINEEISKLSVFTDIHPLQSEADVQGSLEVIFNLGELLKEIIGLHALTFQPSAGAHGELCGLLMAKKYFEDISGKRDTVIIPDSAHGTNFASASIAGFSVLEVKSDKKTGTISIEELKKVIDTKGDEIALMMVTNPNTLGIFEKDSLEIAEIIHENQSLLYYDGANLNAIIGKVRPGDMGYDIVHLNLHKTFSAPHGGGGPGSGPVLVQEKLERFLPTPVIRKNKSGFYFDHDLDKSIGKVKSFYGNFSVLLKAYCYLLSFGSDVKSIAEDAVLNANYLISRLKKYYDISYPNNSMHEFIISARKTRDIGLSALNIAKRLIDYGIHPPTVYFPTIIEEAIMIEPTETENIERLDHFIEAMIKILKEGKQDPDILLNAPVTTEIRRVDELKALKEPVLKEH